MSTFVLNIVCLCVLVITTLTQSNWNQETRDFILDIHNEKRRGVGGCQMNKLVYDNELERQAKQWAERCVFNHEMKKGRGENLGWNSNQKPEKELILHSSGRWYNESYEYNHGQHNCHYSCHYTQMVWASTSKVGCYSHRCPYLVNAVRNAWYLVCFYTPKGNKDGEKPFEKTCKTKCRKGQTEEKGLCVGEVEGGAANAGGDDASCEDDNPNCAMWARHGHCQSNHQYMLEHCRKSCKVCVSKTACEDNNPGCAGWAEIDQCKYNPGYMEKHCKKSCRKC